VVDDEPLVAKALQLGLSGEFDVDITTSADAPSLTPLIADEAFAMLTL